MTINQENPSPKTFCFYTFINNALDLAIEKYKLDLEEAMHLKAIYFFRFYELRALENMLEKDSVFADFEGLKRFSGTCIKLFKKDYDKQISHQYLVSAFRKQLEISKKTEINIGFELNCFNLNINNTVKVNSILDLDEKVYKDAYYTLSKFQAQNIPVELYVVLLYDIALTYLANEDIEHTINSQHMHEIITGQIKTIGKRVYTNEDDMIKFSPVPPSKQDFSYTLQQNVFNGSYALELLASFFGNKLWHKQFDEYRDENSDDYFCFNQEPHFHLLENRRRKEYKDIPLKTSPEYFLSSEFRERFFLLWEYRFHKNEKLFFNKYIKPKMLDKQNQIDFDLSEYEGLDVKTILQGVMDTSSFTYEGKGEFGWASIIRSITECSNIITLHFNTDLYKSI